MDDRIVHPGWTLTVAVASCCPHYRYPARSGFRSSEWLRATSYHLPIAALRDWEQHRSMPDAPARAPDVMRRLLAESAA